MLKIGHRGAPGYPRRGENTVRSFWKAIWSGADAIEFAVRRSKDGRLVVIHDATIDRTTDGSGKVKDLLYNPHLVYRDAGFGEKIPTLDEVFMTFGWECFLHIELKEQGLVSDVIDMINLMELKSRVCLSAFDEDDSDPESPTSWKELEKAGRAGMATALLANYGKVFETGYNRGYKNYIGTAIGFGARAIHPHASVIKEGGKEFIDIARENGLLVNVWTVNKPSEIEYYRKLGVNGIISDFPELL